MPVHSLLGLAKEGQLLDNQANSRSKIIDLLVPKGQAIIFSPAAAQIFRPAAVEIQPTRTVTTDEDTANELVLPALVDTPAKPPARYIPAWPSPDGYTFKIHTAVVTGGTRGDWVPATINSVNWNTRELTIASEHAANTLVDVRVSYAFSTGVIQLSRETPDNEQISAAKVAWTVTPQILNVRDQLHESGRVQFPVSVWAPELCRIRFYLTSPVVFDTDPVLGATMLELFHTSTDMAVVESDYQKFFLEQGLTPRFANVYRFFLAQLTGEVPEGAVDSLVRMGEVF